MTLDQIIKIQQLIDKRAIAIFVSFGSDVF